MPAILDRSETPYVIRLMGEVDIRCAADLKELLVQALALEKELHLDLKGATELDIAALQLLWVALRDARATGKAFTLDGPIPEAIAARVKHSGLSLPVSAA